MSSRRPPAEGDQVTSNLPAFLVKKSTDFPGWLLVTCPREGCGEKPFLVHAATWTRPHHFITHKKEQITIVGRTCPYCSKVGRIPRPGRGKRG